MRLKAARYPTGSPWPFNRFMPSWYLRSSRSMHARISSFLACASLIRSSSSRSPGEAWARFRNIAPAIVSEGRETDRNDNR